MIPAYFSAVMEMDESPTPLPLILLYVRLFFHVFTSISNSINKPQYNTGLTAEDWMNLEEFFMMKRKEFPADDKNYKICSNLITCSQRKDANTMKINLQKIGKEALKMIFTAGTDVAAMQIVKPIINKIYSKIIMLFIFSIDLI